MLSTNQCDKASYRSIAIQDAIVQVFKLKNCYPAISMLAG